MILGIGEDLMDARLLHRSFTFYKDRFTEGEHRLCGKERQERLGCYTKRFAAKEACIKALGVNDVVGGVGFSEIEVVLTKSGRPTIRLTGGALRQLNDITPQGYRPIIHITMTDMLPYASAKCIIEALPIVD